MRRASEASTRLLLLRLSRRLLSSRCSQSLQAAALSTSSSSQHPTDGSKSDGRESERGGKDGHRSRHALPQQREPPHHRHHWLDRRAPAAAEWLDSQARELWLRGLEERCRSSPELAGHELLLRRVVSERAEALARRLSARFRLDEEEGGGEEGKQPPTAATSRARTHLQAAALVRATGDALLPFFRGDERRVLEVLRDATGGRASGALAAALRLQARLAALVPPSLSKHFPAAWGRMMAEERLRLLRNDHGGAWPGAEVVVVADGEEEEDDDEDENGGGKGGRGRREGGSFLASLVPSFLRGSGPSASSDVMVRMRTTTTTLRVPRCLYYEMMTMASDDGGEGGGLETGGGNVGGKDSSSSSSLRPRWLEACCCSVDGVWFEPWASSNGGGNGGGEGDGSLSALATRSSFGSPLVSFRRRRWLGDSGGDGEGAACELCVTRVEAVGSRRERL